MRALRTLGAFGEAGRPASPELVKLIQDGEKRKTLPEAITTLRRIDPDNEAIEKIGIPLLLKGLKPETTEEMKAVLANPLGREEVRVLATLGKSAVKPLIDELKTWSPSTKKNQDYGATLARYQIYKLLVELADNAAADDGLRAALKARLGLLKLTYVPKENALVQQAIVSRLSPANSEPYLRTAFAAKEALDKITALRPAKP